MPSSFRCCPPTSTFTRFRKCIADLLLIAKVRRDENRIGVIANRVKRNTLIYQSLMRFLETLADSRHSDFARLSELRARRRAGGGIARDEANIWWRRTSRTGSRCSRGCGPRRLPGARTPASIPCRKPPERRGRRRAYFFSSQLPRTLSAQFL